MMCRKSLMKSPILKISDKGGDFVVTSNNFQDYITQHHINSNPDVYKFVPSTRRYCGIIKEIANPTENTFRSQIKNKVQLLEELCNDKLHFSRITTVCITRNVDSLWDIYLVLK